MSITFLLCFARKVSIWFEIWEGARGSGFENWGSWF